jgi:ATP phosphoribosyltransferase regulatory subunit
MRRLRDSGETVLAMLPGHEFEAQAFACDRELVHLDGLWVLRALGAASLP